MGLPPREIELTDDMIIADASGRKIALLVDSTEMITNVRQTRKTPQRSRVGRGAILMS